MTEKEYKFQLGRYRLLMNKYLSSKQLKYHAYGKYLQRFFGTGYCDGKKNFEERFSNQILPKSYYEYHQVE